MTWGRVWGNVRFFVVGLIIFCRGGHFTRVQLKIVICFNSIVNWQFKADQRMMGLELLSDLFELRCSSSWWVLNYPIYRLWVYRCRPATSQNCKISTLLETMLQFRIIKNSIYFSLNYPIIVRVVWSMSVADIWEDFWYISCWKCWSRAGHVTAQHFQPQ